MNIDERLKVLAEHLDTLTGMQIETEKRVQELLETSAQLQRIAISLVNITVRHEERLDDLEGKRPH